MLCDVLLFLLSLALSGAELAGWLEVLQERDHVSSLSESFFFSFCLSLSPGSLLFSLSPAASNTPHLVLSRGGVFV